jgi:replicative DNA helicase
MSNHERESLERAILCACLQEPQAVDELLKAGLDKKDFLDKRHQVLWRAMTAMVGRGQVVDPLTILAFLRSYEAEKHAGGAEYVSELLHDVFIGGGSMAERCLQWLRSLRELAAAVDDAAGTAQRRQVELAHSVLERDPSSVMTYPIATLARLRGGWSPGEIDFLAAASNSGKTTLLSTLARRWVGAGRKVYYAGFELPAHQLRLQWAAREAGLLPGDVVSGEYLTKPDGQSVRAKVQAALKEQEERIDYLRCADASFVDVKGLRTMAHEAAEWGADVFIIDHIDHVEGTGDLHGQSRQVVASMLELAKSTGVRFLVATQLNQQGLSQDFLRSHRPVREEYIKQGGHKKEVATFMLGLARAIRKDVTKEELKAVRDRIKEIHTIEEPYTSQVNVMKHRHYGDRVGSVRLLAWERGEYTDYLSPEERKAGAVMRRNDILMHA